VKTTVALLSLIAAPAFAGSLMTASEGTTYSEDPATGALTVLSSNAGTLLVALETNPKTGQIYGLSLSSPLELIALDDAGEVVATAGITYNGSPVALAESLAFSPSGQLYIGFSTGSDHQFQSGHLGRINTSTGVIDPASVVAFSAIGNGTPDADSMSFVGSNLYVGDNASGFDTRLYSAKQSTGVLTLIGHTRDANEGFQVTDMAWDGVTLYGEFYDTTGMGGIISIDPATAASAAIGAKRTIINDGVTSAVCVGKKCR
jgi:hypothetical protein